MTDKMIYFSMSRILKAKIMSYSIFYSGWYYLIYGLDDA